MGENIWKCSIQSIELKTKSRKVFFHTLIIVYVQKPILQVFKNSFKSQIQLWCEEKCSLLSLEMTCEEIDLKNYDDNHII